MAQLADATGATVHGCADPDAVLVDGPVVTDSRACGPGSLYVARVGEHADGHDYAPAAVAAGAVAVLGSRPVDGVPTLVSEDVQTAFGDLARAVLLARRAQGTPLTVLAITGSSGKTSTKDLLAGVLAGSGETVAPVESLNGEIGVPLTICRVEDSTRYLILEMGARGIGHIDYLTAMAPPDVSMVLNVGTAHVGEFGSRANIALAKSELVTALAPSGLAVLNADDIAVRAMAARTAARVVFFGMGPVADKAVADKAVADADADQAATDETRTDETRAGLPRRSELVRATDVVLDDSGRPSFTLVHPHGEVEVHLELRGVHQVSNALAVAAAALELGIAPEAVAERLAEARPVSRWRMEVSERADGVTVVNDAYNANPDSMAAALSALSTMGRAGRRTWAVLGSMLELGADSDAEHATVGALAIDRGVDRLLAVGEGAKALREGAFNRAVELRQQAGSEVEIEGFVRWVPDADTAESMLRAELAPGDIVLFKSSRDAGLRWLGERVAQAADTPAPTSPQTAPTFPKEARP
nr:UDP-N-acetylmuramoyl-tripeptide--D-alanyl-D-alanine ligase [Arsenicicoccus piscis]